MNQHPRDRKADDQSQDEAGTTAEVAAMREALEEVWRICGHQHWPKVDAALREDAGVALLGRLRRAEADRDLLVAALRIFVQTLEAHDAYVGEAANHSLRLPDEGDDPIQIEEPPLRDYRYARRILGAVQATPERAAGLERALVSLEGFANIRSGDAEIPKGFILRQLSEEIPHLVTRSLAAEPPPTPRSVDPVPREADELLIRKIGNYERALREIGDFAPFVNADQQEHELSHMLEVEIPELARRILDEYREHPADDDVDPDDDFWIPF